MANKIPEGFQTITATLVLKDAAKAIQLYEKAFGAKEVYRMEVPGSSKVAHACLQVGSSKLFISDVNPEMGCSNATNSSFYLYVNDVDAAFRQAKQAGLNEVAPLTDQFWGDRTGCLTDSFGVQWTLSTHVRDVSEDEMKEAMKQWAKAA